MGVNGLKWSTKMTMPLYMTIILSTFAACYGWEYIITLWNRCHENSYVDLYNRSLSTCILECALREPCIAVQYERIRRTCGILTTNQLQDPLGTCKKFLYVKRSDMKIKPESCAPYKNSSIHGKCITECVFPENPRIYSTVQGFPSVGSRIKLTCAPPLTLHGDQSIRCKEDGQFSSIPICRLSNDSNDSNVALGKPTWQSSDDYDGVSSRAVDGLTNGYYQKGHCTHTRNETRPWWIVDLELIFVVQTVVVYNRNKEDCCHERFSRVYIITSPTNNISNGELKGTLCSNMTGPFDDPIIIFNCSPNALGRYLKIILDKRDPLTLCEVQVFVATI